MMKIFKIFLILALITTSVEPADAFSFSKKITQSVVQIITPHKQGSGLFISETGTIITNFHVVQDNRGGAYDGPITICLQPDLKKDKVCLAEKFELANYSALSSAGHQHDLALLRPQNDRQGWGYFDISTAINRLLLMGFFDTLAPDVGEEIVILGFPGVGGGSITATRGIVSGYTIDRLIQGGEDLPGSENLKGITLIKTDAKVNPGNSGGPAFDRQGSFIGVVVAVSGGGGNIGWIISPGSISAYLMNAETIMPSNMSVDLSLFFNSAEARLILDRAEAFWESFARSRLGESSNPAKSRNDRIVKSTSDVDSSSPPVSNSFHDISPSHKNYRAIQTLSERGILNGYEDGTFRPDGAITRAELVKIAWAASNSPLPNLSTDCFSDISHDSWMYVPVCRAKAAGWVGGFGDGSFRPNAPVTRAEALKIVMSASDIASNFSKSRPFGDVFGSQWFAGYVGEAADRGLLERTSGDFEPDTRATRGWVAEVVYRAL